MLKHSDVITNNLLFNLQNVEISRKFVKFLSAHGIDKSGLADTISSNKSILSTSRKSENCFVKQGLTTSNKSDCRTIYISFGVCAFVVDDFWRRTLLLGCNELIDFLVKSIFGLSLFQIFLVLFLLEPGFLVLRDIVISSVCSLVSQQWI